MGKRLSSLPCFASRIRTNINDLQSMNIDYSQLNALSRKDNTVNKVIN